MNFKEEHNLPFSTHKSTKDFSVQEKCQEEKSRFVIMSRSNLLRSRLYPLFILLLFLLTTQDVSAVHYSHPIPCGNPEQREIMEYSTQTACMVRENVLDLKPFVANMTDVIHVVPDVAVVMRCGGNCIRPSHRCIPVLKRTRSIPVMMIISRFPHGNHETVCGHVEVEEHVECGCDCPIRSEDCRRARIGDPTSQSVVEKYFDSGSCRCLCRNTERRHACIVSGMEWDESTCRCRCPLSRWQHCSTGYVFDYENTCRCVPTSMTASLGLIAALIVLIVCILVTAVGFFTMYRRQTGLFRQSRRERIVRESQLSKDQGHHSGVASSSTPLTTKQNLKKNYDLVLTKETNSDKK